MKTIFSITFILFCLQIKAQTIIGNTSLEPKATLHITSTPNDNNVTDGVIFPSITREQLTQKTGYGPNQAGTIIYVSIINGTVNTATKYVTSIGTYFFDGQVWQRFSPHNIGDIKYAILTEDHDGWIKLDGRSTNNLTSSQRAQASSLGFYWSIPDATDKTFMQTSGAVGSTTGNNTATILRQNLPNVDFTGSIEPGGEHTHDTNSGSNNGEYGVPRLTLPSENRGHPNTPDLVSGTLKPDLLSTPTNQFIPNSDLQVAMSIGHTHTYSVNTGGTSTPIDITPSSLSANAFIYLGN